MISMLQSSLVTVSVVARIERIKDYGENKISQPQRSCFTYEERNTETSHTDINTANFKIIDIKFSNNKRKQKIA